jgi:hypothetical protein
VFRQTYNTPINYAPNAAEVQLNLAAITLKANTQYQILTAYYGNTNGNGTWYWIVRVTEGSPYNIAAMIGNATATVGTGRGGGGVSSFMTGSGTAYTVWWFVKNNNTVSNLILSNLAATITELP